MSTKLLVQVLLCLYLLVCTCSTCTCTAVVIYYQQIINGNNKFYVLYRISVLPLLYGAFHIHHMHSVCMNNSKYDSTNKTRRLVTLRNTSYYGNVHSEPNQQVAM